MLGLSWLMEQGWVRCVVGTFAIILAGTPSLYAQRSASKSSEVAVVVLKDGAQVQGVRSDTERELRALGYDVVLRTDLLKRLKARHLKRDALDPAKASKFDGLRALIKEGSEEFYSGDEQDAIARLQPVFQLASEHSDYLAFHPQVSENIYEASVILLRAYRAQKDTQEAERVAITLVQRFPTYLPTTRTTPPDVIEFLKGQGQKLHAESKTALALPALSQNEGCRLYVNGLLAKPDTSYSVQGGEALFFAIDCGLGIEDGWAFTPTENQSVQIPLIPGSPADYQMTDNAIGSQMRAEEALSALRFWSGVDMGVGVVSDEGGPTPISFVVVRPDARPSWFGAGQAVGNTIRQMVPAVDGKGNTMASVSLKGHSESDPAPSGRWWPWMLGGAGVASIGTGVALWFVAEQQDDRIRCSPNVDGRSKVGCEDVEEPYMFESPEAKADQESARDTLYAAGVAVGVVGLAVTGYAIYELLSGAESSSAEGSVSQNTRRYRWDVSLTPQRASLGWTVHF